MTDPLARKALSDRGLFATVFVVAALLATPLSHANENRTLDLVHALARGTLTIDREHENTGDKAYVPTAPSAAALELSLVAPPTALRGGHFYCGGAPGLATVLLPAYLALRPCVPERLLPLALTILGAALPLALGAVGVARAVRGAATRSPAAFPLGPATLESVASVTALVHALATIALPFGTRLFGHSLVVCLFAWSLALLLRPDRARAFACHGLAGLLAAIAVSSDYNAAPQAALLGALALVAGGPRGALAFALGTLPAAVALGVYHQECFGSPWKTPYDFHWDGSIVATLHQGSYGFTFPRAWIVAELLGGTRRGLLFTQPAALLGLLGLLREARRSPACAVALAATAAALGANASRAIDWDGGSCFGARYATSALPFLALGLPSGVALLGRTGRRGVAVAAILGVSSLLAFVGATTPWGYSVQTCLDWLWLLGPRLSGLSELVLGSGENQVDASTVLVAAAGLSVAFPVAWAGWRRADGRPLEPTGLAAAALVPWVACLPVAFALFAGGPAAVLDHHRRVVIRESERAIAGARDAEEMRRLVWQVAMRARDDKLPGLYLEALERLVELDPADDEARAKRDRLRERLAPSPAPH